MARSPKPLPAKRSANLTREQALAGIQRLRKRIEDLEAFGPASVNRRGAPEVQALTASIDEALHRTFGHDTIEYERYELAARLDDSPSFGGETPLERTHQYLQEDKERSLALLRQAVRGLEEEFIPEASAPATSSPSTPDDTPMTDAALTEIREVVNTIKTELPAVTLSNSANADITADIKQIEVEIERPTPRRRFIKMYLESLRDNLAKAAGAATAGGMVALIAGVIAKYFHVF